MRNLTILVNLFLLLAFSKPSVAADPVPVQEPTISFEQTAKALLIRATPPKDYHFNLEAPAHIKEGEKQYRPSQQKPGTLEFALPLAKKPNAVRKFTGSLFLCDNAQTFCVIKPIQTTYPPLTNSPAKE